MHIGIDLGGTKTEIIVLNSQKQEVYRKREATDKKSYQQVLQQLTRLVREAELQLSTNCTIGIGIPGTLSPDHGNVKNANSTVLIGHPLDRDLAALLHRPVKIANDANCFTLSEAIDGAGSGAQS
ncbi:MAG: ROK family protein, partial [Pseudomonadales bacterium]|nr:ROK family protein [Pseudomonadales bacterium]